MENKFEQNGGSKEIINLEKLKNDLKIWLKSDMIANHEEWQKFHKKLEEKYPDWSDYEMYHFGISTPSEKLSNFDFPDEDSIVKFIEDKNKELL